MKAARCGAPFSLSALQARDLLRQSPSGSRQGPNNTAPPAPSDLSPTRVLISSRAYCTTVQP